MNAFYVTVSIPLLLVLAGFNHAHGLTTFGKSNMNSNNNNPDAVGKTCSVQSDCSPIKNTTCYKGTCLCGDNHAPVNAECSITLQGPNHICTKNEDCVDNAECVPVNSLKPTKDIAHLFQPPDLNICRCQEGYLETGATCGGGINTGTVSILLIAAAIYKVLLN